MSAPRHYPGVMISSTFADLAEHRAALMSAIQGQHLHPVVMESDSARPVTVIESSLEKVRDAAAYILIIGRRYGSVPDCAANPDGLSLTHLEFREAMRLGRPVLVFIMGADHLLTESGVEFDPGKRAKLEAFREEAKLAGGQVDQVYQEFNDLAEFATSATQAISELRQTLQAPGPPSVPENGDRVPVAPALYSRPRYLGSHDFVGRKAQLATLSDWARPAGQHALLLFEAIGGSGKSILTWEWTTRHAPGVRGDWAGRFWYSFYEAGAVMSDFCRRALAYMTGMPLAAFESKGQRELTEMLVYELESRPWLLVLDGLERVLVAYRRIDAARVLDEEADGGDQIARRDPCAAIRPDDDDLLQRLAGATPSRILITSRLVPRALLNHSNQMIPGVLHERLPGLRPADAEVLMRACGVTGNSAAMRSFLQRHCDCHPLVTGIVAGLVNDYMEARGDFDRWSTDPQHGLGLDVGALDLVQKRNHILFSAIDALSDASGQLLATLALLTEAVDYETLTALSPHADAPTASRDLARTVKDLERRGLLQYDRQTGHHDLHPVVRSVVASDLGALDRAQLGGRVVDFFSTRAPTQYEHVTSVDELRDVLSLIRTLTEIGRTAQAVHLYSSDLEWVLRYHLEAVPERWSLLRPFFQENWSAPVLGLPDAAHLANCAGDVLEKLGEYEQGLAACEVALRLSLQERRVEHVVVNLHNVTLMLEHLNRLSACRRLRWLNLDLAASTGSSRYTFQAQAAACQWLYATGQVTAGVEMWRRLPAIPDGRYSAELRCGAALEHAQFRFDQGTMRESVLSSLEKSARRHRFRHVVRGVHRLRGTWLGARGDWEQAAVHLNQAVHMAREVGLFDATAETELAFVQLRLGRLAAPAQAAARLAAEREQAHLPLAKLWLESGDVAKAVEHALAAYRFAWADGEPYTRRFDLRRAKRLLEELGTEVPVLPSYDPADDREFWWEAHVREFMATLR